MSEHIRNTSKADEPDRTVAFGPHQIFVSYRRSDTQIWASRVAADLRLRFGDARVFWDIDSDRPAIDYRRVVEETLAQSRVMIALVGPMWASCVDGHGRVRLADPDDLVRIEVERALGDGIPILPVFVGGAAMPKVNDLPVSLASFARIQGMALSDDAWPYDFQRILERLERMGLRPEPGAGDEPEGAISRIKRSVVGVQTYERVLVATKPTVYRAVIGAVETLRYPRTGDDSEAFRTNFTIYGRSISVKVIDASRGQSKVIVELTTLKTTAIVASVITGPYALVGVAARLLDRRFAVGFLDNVQRILEGRGIGPDSSLPPGVERWRRRSREV